jgi:hypothetical protein
MSEKRKVSLLLLQEKMLFVRCWCTWLTQSHLFCSLLQSSAAPPKDQTRLRIEKMEAEREERRKAMQEVSLQFSYSRPCLNNSRALVHLKLNPDLHLNATVLSHFTRGRKIGRKKTSEILQRVIQATSILSEWSDDGDKNISATVVRTRMQKIILEFALVYVNARLARRNATKMTMTPSAV